MKFGPVPIENAIGAILAHATKTASGVFRKGRTLSAADCDVLRDYGIETVVAALLEAGDLAEDAVAERLAGRLAGSDIRLSLVSTGRANLHAKRAGLFLVDKDRIDAFNRVDPALTLATLRHRSAVVADQMIATVKIIPLAVGGTVVEQAETAIGQVSPLRLLPFSAKSIALIATTLPSLKPTVMDKTRRILERRLEASGSSIRSEQRIAHREEDLSQALRNVDGQTDLIVIFGASAVIDPQDVIPAAIRAAGGSVDRVGMPVDPGNLLVSGSLSGRPVIGAPGCARSPKENGFDWVLDSLLADHPLDGPQLAEMGVGGLLPEISSRPAPRRARQVDERPRIAAIVLAAGQSKRMKGGNKLLARFGTTPLVRQTVDTVLASAVDEVLVVTGHQSDQIRLALQGAEVGLVDNSDYREGLSSSIRAGIGELDGGFGGALVVLADMPRLTTEAVNAMIEAFHQAGPGVIVRATADGKAGNPVLFSAAHFPALARVEGDSGARHVVAGNRDVLVEVEIGDAALVDVDTREALEREGGKIATSGSAGDTRDDRGER